MSNILNCRRCGKIFSYTGKPVCPECVQKEEEDFETARAYIKENPGRNMQEVSEETGVPVKLLTKFLREGRIEFLDGSVPFLSCGSCGAPITSGRFCNNCLSKLGKEMLGAVPDKKPARPADPETKDKGMHLSRLNRGDR